MLGFKYTSWMAMDMLINLIVANMYKPSCVHLKYIPLYFIIKYLLRDSNIWYKLDIDNNMHLNSYPYSMLNCFLFVLGNNII